MFVFGAGLIWAHRNQSADGSVVTNQTPLLLGTCQEASLEFTEELKSLYGAKKYPVDIAAGKATVKGTSKVAEFSADLFNTLFFGVSVTDSGEGVVADTVGQVVAATVNITPPNSGTFVADLGVVFEATAKTLQRVASAPKTGEYSVTDAGVYTFSEDDVDEVVYINYKYTSDEIKGRAIEMTNSQMGYKASFAMDFYSQRDGKTMLISLDKCISESLKIAFKSDDFAIPEFAYQAMANSADKVGRIQIME